MELLREWRALTGGAGVPTLAHGNDIIIGFNAERYAALRHCCEYTSDVDADALEESLTGGGG